jgi:hypothetical protein
VLGRPARAGDRFAGEVHDGAGAVDVGAPRSLVAGQDDDVVAVGGEGGGEGAAEEAGAAGDDDLHGALV